MPDNSANNWRSFNVHSSYYDSDQKKRLSFITRWYLPSGPRWARINVPQVRTMIQLFGYLLGRLRDKHEQESSAPLAIQLHALDFLGPHSSASSDPSLVTLSR